MRYNDISPTLLEDEIDDVPENSLMIQEPIEIRKPSLTLRMLNKLKKIRSSNELERVKKQSILGVMYAAPPEDEGF